MQQGAAAETPSRAVTEKSFSSPLCRTEKRATNNQEKLFPKLSAGHNVSAANRARKAFPRHSPGGTLRVVGPEGGTAIEGGSR
jgi:hypothetical protein